MKGSKDNSIFEGTVTAIEHLRFSFALDEIEMGQAENTAMFPNASKIINILPEAKTHTC